MIGRKITIGLSLLCALVFCAFAASSASALGQTYVTCVKGGGNLDFKDADCTENVKIGTGSFGHETISGKTPTPTVLVLTSAKAKLMGSIGGITTTLEATGFTSKSAIVENNERASKEMVALGSGEGEYTGVTLVEGPEGCKVKGSTVKQLSTKSESVAASMEVEFKPVGASFAEFTLEGCKTKELNITYKVIGTANGTPSGANLNFTEASTKNLKFAGQAAFFIATDTLSMEGGGPISNTTL